MATSSKRYGLEVKGDLELELRLRRMEAKIDQLAGSSDLGTSDQTQRVSTIPLVTGLRVKGKTPGATTLAWNQLRLSNLRRYELQIAENLAFTTNAQTFNVAGTEFTFSTLEEEGGGGGSTIYARVRARTTDGNVGQYSAVLNTTTGQAQTTDIADQSVTEDKLSAGGNVPPDPSTGTPFQHVRISSAGTDLEYGYKFPENAGTDTLLISDGTNYINTPYTFPANTTGKNLTVPIVVSGNVQFSAWTIPNSITSGQLLIGTGSNAIGQTTLTFPSTISSGRLFRASAANTVAQTSYEFPSAATADNVIAGNGTNFVLVDQNPSDAAASTTTHSNRSGSVTLAGGLTLHWDTVDTTSGVDFTVGGFTALRSVMACWGEAAGTAAPVKTYISTANTTLTIRQDSGANMEVTYWAIEEL